MSVHLTNNVPNSYFEAKNSANWQNWKLAMENELDSLNKHKVWEIIQKPAKSKLIETKWVYSLKQDDAGKNMKYKARLVAAGFNQIKNIDYSESYSPVVNIESFRLLIALAAKLKLNVNFFYVKTAYLYGDLEEMVYVLPPPGYEKLIGDAKCDICANDLMVADTIQVPCAHLFCKECWNVYLTAKIVDGETHNILCPAYECSYVVPVDVIEKLVSPDMVKRYLQFDIKAFVESNPTMKWCPYPACARAVKLPDIEKINDELLAISFSTPPALSHSIDCGNGHYFCWECLGEAHAPCGCEKWREWHNKIAEIKPQELKNTYSESEEAENSLWMVTNSKPCPNCNCPIQRNEGCNHMKCTKASISRIISK
ncbi:ankyrin repeat and IBR domain-containing protein 1 [Trichonephila clavipes]|nr:ankyrin repeat and IBR domain-containing protein 1 [Trichonephila clavipes]